MRSRLMLGPVMVVMLLLGLWADEWLDLQTAPAWARWGGKETWPPGTLLFLVCVAMSVWASRELAGMLMDKGIQASKRVMTTAALIGLVVSCLVPSSMAAVDAVAIVSTAAMVVMGGSIIFFCRHKTVQGVVAATGGSLLAFVYLGLMFGFLLAIRREHSAWTVLWAVLVTKSCDIGAYFTGRAIGRHKLIPWLSPGKTWEGLVGGVVMAVIVAYFGWWLVRPSGQGPPAWWLGVVPGVVLGLIGQIGDLFESVLKRDAGRKDSGQTIPGFGGVLDVLDSPLLAAPFAFWWIRYLDTLP